MFKSRELRLRCKECEKNITWNEKKACEECDTVIKCDLGVINNNNEQEANDTCVIKCDKVTKTNKRKK